MSRPGSPRRLTRAAYRPAFGIAPRTTVDADPSDEGTQHLLFASEPYGLNIHKAGNNVLFADGHVETFSSFDPTRMTYDPTQMLNWGDVN